MERLFLDANVLFSAAYREDSGLRRLWQLEDCELATSEYAIEEARRNLEGDEGKRRLARLLKGVEIVGEASPGDWIPEPIDLPEKDRPILATAIAAAATHLVTGDLRHFGAYMGQEVGGVRIVRPATFLRDR